MWIDIKKLSNMPIYILDWTARVEAKVWKPLEPDQGSLVTIHFWDIRRAIAFKTETAGPEVQDSFAWLPAILVISLSFLRHTQFDRVQDRDSEFWNSELIHMTTEDPCCQSPFLRYTSYNYVQGRECGSWSSELLYMTGGHPCYHFSLPRYPQ